MDLGALLQSALGGVNRGISGATNLSNINPGVLAQLQQQLSPLSYGSTKVGQANLGSGIDSIIGSLNKSLSNMTGNLSNANLQGQLGPDGLMRGSTYVGQANLGTGVNSALQNFERAMSGMTSGLNSTGSLAALQREFARQEKIAVAAQVKAAKIAATAAKKQAKQEAAMARMVVSQPVAPPPDDGGSE